MDQLELEERLWGRGEVLDLKKAWAAGWMANDKTAASGKARHWPKSGAELPPATAGLRKKD